MFLIRIIRFFMGYAEFKAEKGFPERFINLCSLQGITLWDAKCSEGLLTGKTHAKNYKKLRDCARRSGMSLHLTEKRGLPFIIHPYRKRYGIFTGLALSLAVVILLNSTVWQITVAGNDKYTAEQILSLAADYGVYPGAFKKNLDPKKIREAIKADNGDINWFSVNIDGGSVFLEVTENTGQREILDTETPCNLISDADGELIRLEVYSGQKAKSVGSGVAKGDLLISGVVERADETTYFTHARGVAVVRTRESLEASVASNIEVRKISEIKKGYYIYLFGLKIPLGFSKDKEPERTENHYAAYRDAVLPVGFITEKYPSEAAEKMELSNSRCILLGGYEAFEKEISLMENSVTESKKAMAEATSSGVKVKCDYINHKSTGYEVFFKVEDIIN